MRDARLLGVDAAVFGLVGGALLGFFVGWALMQRPGREVGSAPTSVRPWRWAIGVVSTYGLLASGGALLLLALQVGDCYREAERAGVAADCSR